MGTGASLEPPYSRCRRAGGSEVRPGNESELVIHRPNGQIRDKDSFGNDPNPPRDRKH